MHLISQLRARAGGRGQPGNGDLAVNSREIGNCAFDLCHPRTAMPASGEMGTNSIGAAGLKVRRPQP
jgi:hypothetical protein